MSLTWTPKNGLAMRDQRWAFFPLGRIGSEDLLRVDR